MSRRRISPALRRTAIEACELLAERSEVTDGWAAVVLDDERKPDQYEILRGAWTLRVRTNYEDGQSHGELICRDVRARESWFSSFDDAKAAVLAWCREVSEPCPRPFPERTAP